MKIEKKKYYATLITIFGISLLLAIASITYNVKSRKEVILNKITITDKLDYYAYLKPNYLFENKTVLKNSMIYMNITKEIVAVYSFSVKCTKGVAYGDYEVLAELSTREWSKKITLIPKKTFKGTYFLRFPIDVEMFKDMYNRINHELGFKGTDPNVKITIKTNVKAENYSKVYTHAMSFPLLSKAFKISTEHTTSSVDKVRKKVTVIDENKIRIRTILGILSVSMFISAGIFWWRVKPFEVKKDEATMLYERFKDFIVLGKLEDSKYITIEVESFEELLKIAEILNKPIIKDNKKFGIVDDQTLYLYELTTSYSPT